MGTLTGPGKNRLAAALLAVGGALSAWGGVAAWRASAAPDLSSLPAGRSAPWYATYGKHALRAGRADLALAAARLETEADPGSAGAWTRRAYLATALAGRPDREALAAFEAAFDAQPYPPPAQMVWRVGYAEAHWAAMPDPLAARALDQVAALGVANIAWDERIAWCAGSRVAALAAAACATTPGVERGVRLKPRPAGR